MIDKEVYSCLEKKYSDIASWTIWSDPEKGNWSSKSKIDDMSIFKDDDITEKLKSDYIFVGYNPAKHNTNNNKEESWCSFHSGDSKRGQDYKLRYALHETPYEGSFIIDLYPEIIETDSARVESEVDLQMTSKSIKRLLEIRELLGGKATIIAIGNKAHNILKKELSKEQLSNNIILKKITHYAVFINPDNYKDKVQSQFK